MKHKNAKKLLTLSALLLLVLSVVFGCENINPPAVTEQPIVSLEIRGSETIYLHKGYTTQLETNVPEEQRDQLTWVTAGDVITITEYGFVTAKNEGTVIVTVMADGLTDSVTIIVLPDGAEIPIPDTEIATNAPDTERPTEGDETQTPDPTPDTEAPTAEKDTEPSEPPVVTDPVETEEPTDVPTDEPVEDPTEPQTEPVTAEPETETELATEPETEPETEYIPPTVIIEAERSPQGYKPAGSYQEALDRTQRGELSGYPYVPDQAPNVSEYRPMEDGKYVKNNDPYYIDENTYVVVDAYGREVFRIYRGGAYITLEEVAAYVWAFGDIPANHSTSKSTRPTSSIWGEYLRVNHTKFSGDTSRYPYEPVLPRISGCGGDFTYYEMDIGTTGTDCDPNYYATIYNNGTKITRGAARIVYARFDRNGNKIIDPDEKYVFYTYNHYNDFQEYLNYYGGWGEMFGNITGGGTISSKYDYNPTPYVPVALASLRVTRSMPGAEPRATILWYDFRRMSECLAWDKSRFAA